MRVTSKGEVTIPVEIRERLGLLPDTEVDFVVDGDAALIVKRSESGRSDRGAKVVHQLRGIGTVKNEYG